MEKPVKVNKRCLVRNQECKRIFEGSRICFIASPANDEVKLELDIIQEKLRSVNIEPYVAVEQRELQKDIFCEKICSKIIESNFCIVILNDVEDKADQVRKPNANVYYEYGLMTAFGKKIIPIQLEGHKLAFNIQSLDTIKYDKGNFSTQIDDAIRSTLLTEKEDDASGPEIPQIVDWVIDILGLVKVDSMMVSRYMRSMNIKSLGFSLYNHPEEDRFYFVGSFKDDVPIDSIIFNAKMLTIRVGNYLNDLDNQRGNLTAETASRARPSTVIESKISEMVRLISSLQQAKILILKDNIEDIEALSTMYAEASDGLENKMKMEIINAEKARAMLDA